VKPAASIAKARALMNLGQQTAAAALVSSAIVPTAFQYQLTFDQDHRRQQLWALNNSAGRYTVSDSVDNITGRIPTRCRSFPRKILACRRPPRPSAVRWCDAAARAADLSKPQRPDPLVSGLDARLLEAESKMAAGDYAGMMTILNALRLGPEDRQHAHGSGTCRADDVPATNRGRAS